ncbi:hypothetical protein HF086_005227 [Spodoptera exigua]|uniref:Uncharacterized protein n=1 Tax=Spodoptera exigua TaxID=7107 RepID=A0A922MZ07_SPOEX|nr:hypothetical protein HF086_005227 [Spodoptera exigua]
MNVQLEVRKDTRNAGVGDMWAGFTKLPHLSGRSKPLHRRNTTGQVNSEELKPEVNLAHAISVSRPLGDSDSTTVGTLMGDVVNVKDGVVKRKQFAATKAASYDVASCTSGLRADIDVKHLAVQLPNTSSDSLETVVSGSAPCCAWLCGREGAARALVRALAACAPRAPLAVRLAYTLGNMAAADERARNDIYNEDGAIDVLLTILESYTKKNPQDLADVEADPDLHLVGSDLGGSDGSNEDVLIKDKSLPENMPPVERAEELATAALATLNNMTFYREPPDPPDPLHVPIDNICKEDSSVRCAAAGVLVNVCGAGAECAAGGALAARALAAAAARRDPLPAPLLARALWNAHAHHPYPLSPIHTHAVSEALAVFIDDESVFAACEADKLGEQCANNQNIAKHHVTFDLENNNYAPESSCYDTTSKRISRKNSLEKDGDVTGEDLGFEEGDVEECWCEPCRRLASWDELVGVAIPLLERLRPPRADASVGTE